MIDFATLVGSLVLGIIGWATYKTYIWPYYISPLRNIPGPPSDSILFGSIKRFFTKEGDIVVSWIKKYGKIVKYHGAFNRPIILVADEKAVQEITVNNAYNFIKPRRMLGHLLAVTGDGILFAEGESHKRQRKMMNPAFTYNNIKDMVPTFTHVSLTLKRLIEEKLDSGESNVNLTPYLSKATLDVIGLVGFDYEFNSLTSSNELAEAYHKLMNTELTKLSIFLRIASNYIPFLRKLPLEDNRNFRSAINTVKRTSKKLIEEKYRKAKLGELDGKDLLSILINANKMLPLEERMTDEELSNQIMTFLVAGHETTSISISWSLYLLAEHLHEQDKLREELVKAFPDKSKFNPTYDEISSLEYLNCIVKETLRLRSPALVISRSNTEEVVFGGYHIPKDTPMMVSISGFHTLSSVWGPTAENFDPKRWLDPSLNITSTDFLPFINGPRNCIGSKLALMEYKLMLCMLVRNFVFQPIEGFQVKQRLFPILKPDPYLALNVSRVEA